jgi:hypothetical protein
MNCTIIAQIAQWQNEQPNAIGSTFAFFQPHKTQQKCKRATNPTHQKQPKTIKTE